MKKPKEIRMNYRLLIASWLLRPDYVIFRVCLLGYRRGYNIAIFGTN